jgi:cell filamentation protein
MQWLALSRGDDSSRAPSIGVTRPRRRSRVARSLARSRYDVGRRTEAQFEPGSRRAVLKNLPGIKSARAMAAAEERGLVRVTRESLETCGQFQRFTADDVRNFHRAWLRGIYAWAGEYRLVNVSKGGFLFAAADRVPSLMTEFEAGPLLRNTPASRLSRGDVALALAETHVELVLIHPFRDGNGRTARHFANLMAWQAGLGPLDFSAVLDEANAGYFRAIRAGLVRDYDPMRRIFARLIDGDGPPG